MTRAVKKRKVIEIASKKSVKTVDVRAPREGIQTAASVPFTKEKSQEICNSDIEAALPSVDPSVCQASQRSVKVDESAHSEALHRNLDEDDDQIEVTDNNQGSLIASKKSGKTVDVRAPPEEIKVTATEPMTKEKSQGICDSDIEAALTSKDPSVYHAS